MSAEVPSIFELMTDKSTTLTEPSGESLLEMLKECDPTILAAMITDNLFGERLDDADEYLFLNTMLDETEALQSEFISKLEDILDMQGYTAPDCWSLQVFKRKAGFKQSRTDADFGKYSMAICLKDYQMVVYDNQEYSISIGQNTPCFELTPHPQSKKQKPAPRPCVPKNTVKIVNAAGKPSLKARHYCSILVWVFWNENPIKKERQFSDEGLKKALEAAQKKIEDEETRGHEIEAANETVLYNVTQ